MADFTQKSVVRSAVRKLTAPIADYTTFHSVVQGVLENNPWGCTSYQTSGKTYPAVEISKEAYAAGIEYENREAKTVGSIQVKAPSMDAVNTIVTQITGNATITNAMGNGFSASRDTSGDSFSCTLKCHNPNGELYLVTFRRDNVTISSFEADAILTGIETWADTIPALA